MEKILFIHLSRLGDMIQSLPAIKLIKKQKPACEISYLGYADFCSLLKEVSEIDRLIEIPCSYAEKISDINFQKSNLVKLLADYPLLSEQYDFVINITHNLVSSHLTSLIKAKKISGCVLSPNGEIIANGKWAKYFIAASHLQKYNLINLADIYIGMTSLSNEHIFQYLTAYNKDTTLSNMEQSGYQRNRLTIGFQPGARDEKRMWPLEYFVKLGKNLAKQDMQVLLFGSPTELDLAESFAALANFPYIDLVGKTSLTDLPSYLNFVDVLVSNDTGTMHIAAALGKKVVGIFTAMAYHSMTGPYGEGHVALQAELPCSPCVRATACENALCRNSIKPEAVEIGVKIALGLDYDQPQRDIGAGIYVSSLSGNNTIVYKSVHFAADSFFASLRRLDERKAIISQHLWNSWLGLKNDCSLSELTSHDRDEEIIKEMQTACNYYQTKYSLAITLCNSITDEFAQINPSIEKINNFIKELKKLEKDVPLTSSLFCQIYKIHELYMAEVPVCDFPRLTDYLRSAYSDLLKLVTNFSYELEGKVK